MESADSGTPSAPQPRKGRFIAIGLAVLWFALLIGLYIVIVRLKMGGAEALRAPSMPASPSTPATKPPPR